MLQPPSGGPPIRPRRGRDLGDVPNLRLGFRLPHRRNEVHVDPVLLGRGETLFSAAKRGRSAPDPLAHALGGHARVGGGGLEVVAHPEGVQNRRRDLGLRFEHRRGAGPGHAAMIPCAPMNRPPVRLERRKTADLELDPHNARKHPARNLAAIKASLARWGQQRPIVISEQGKVWAGNGVVLAARELGIEDLAVAVTTLEGSEAVAYAIADNRIAELATWNDDVLGPSLRDLAEQGIDPETLGFTRGQLDQVLNNLDPERWAETVAATSPPENPDTKRGDVFDFSGGHRLVCGDATDPADVAAAVGETSPVLMVTDPPYGVLYDPKREGMAKVIKKNAGARGKVLNDDQADWTAAWRLSPAPIAYVFHAGISTGLVGGNLAEAGYQARTLIVWVKSKLIPSRGRYNSRKEMCWYAVRKNEKDRWTGATNEDDVWEIDHLAKKTDGATVHGTQKPVALMARPMRSHGAPGDVVYEPFAGSGTTFHAALKMDRVCVGLELNPAYVDVIRERLEGLGIQVVRRSRVEGAERR